MCKFFVHFFRNNFFLLLFVRVPRCDKWTHFCGLSDFALAPEHTKKYIKCEKNVKKTCVCEKKVVILHSILVNLMLINS